MDDIFISYSRADEIIAERTYQALSAQNWSVWLDRQGIREGDPYDKQIEVAIASSKVVIVIWSEHSVRSQWVRAEAAYALSKQKLVPVKIDREEPPLQFLHIQAIDLREWDGTATDPKFQQLIRRLKRRIETATSEIERLPLQGIPIVPISGSSTKRTSGLRLLVKLGLQFSSKELEIEFLNFFYKRTYRIAQFSFIMAVITYAIFGLSDMLSSTGGIQATRFRFMVGCPTMLLLFGVSFTSLARLHSQYFISTFIVIATLCVYKTVILTNFETVFHYEAGYATMNFMLALAFIALAPLRSIYTIAVGLLVMLLHAEIVYLESSLPIAISNFNQLNVCSAFGVTCFISYWREYSSREIFFEVRTTLR
jgi:TIR domain